MSTSYSLHIKRKDGKEIAETVADGIVKTILDADEDLLDTRNKSEFGISRFYDIERRCEEEIVKLTDEINRLKEGIFKCKSVEVKHEIEEDIVWKEECLGNWISAAKAAREGIGVIECLSENLIIRAKDRDAEGESDGDGRMSYSYWSYPTGKKTEAGYDDKQFCWADTVSIWIDDGY